MIYIYIYIYTCATFFPRAMHSMNYNMCTIYGHMTHSIISCMVPPPPPAGPELRNPLPWRRRRALARPASLSTLLQPAVASRGMHIRTCTYCVIM